ncbi:MAG: DUF5689 domain-containing protein [Bacteroidota bacterium]
MKKIGIILSAALLSAITFTSCVKQKYDSPPDQSTIDPNLPVNVTVGKISSMALQGTRQILGDSTIEGIVVADDKSGNFYKQIIIQDSTGGIVIKLDATNLYNDYPIGRKLYVNLKGLFIGNYKNSPQIGYALDNSGAMTSIPTNLRDNYIVKATYPNTLPLLSVSLNDLENFYANIKNINCRVKIDSVEFAVGSYGVPYAQLPTIKLGTSLNIEDCNGNAMVMYNSGYANWQPFLTPSGKGSLIAIYSVYGTSPQLLLNDTTDIKFYGDRCHG